jgi:hypothetical protein
MQQGQEVGALAQRLYPNGVLVPPGPRQLAIEITRRDLADAEVETIFEGTAVAGPFVAKADILSRVAGGWHLLEVKSSFSDTKDMSDLVDDLAYTVMVFKRAGVQVVKASLLLLSREYHFGEDPSRLFEMIDQTVEIQKRAAEFDATADSIANALFNVEPPPPKLVPVCRDCAVFGDRCLGADLEHTVLEIPGLRSKTIMQLAADGIVDLADLPEDLKLNGKQRRAVDSAVSGKMIVEAGLRDALNAIIWPCHYLDFETVNTVLPLYEGHRCHQQVLTQFSIHHRDRIDSEVRHTEFLADPRKDCERELAEALIQALGQHGSIIVYTSFEKTRIKGLQALFPDLAAPLEAILNRLVDLCAIISDHVYHPDFHGSFSIKKVLPALVPGLSYKGLAIRDGEMAVTRFARMARGEIAGAEIEKTRRELLEYCKLDTLAMVRLHEKLVEIAAGEVGSGAQYVAV